MCSTPNKKVSQKNTSTKEQEMQRNNSSGNNRASRTVTMGRMSWAISRHLRFICCMIRFSFRMIVPIVIQKGMNKGDIRTQKNREKTVTTV